MIFFKRVVYKATFLLYYDFGKRFPENIFHKTFITESRYKQTRRRDAYQIRFRMGKQWYLFSDIAQAVECFIQRLVFLRKMQADKAVHGLAEEARTRHCADSDITREDIAEL